jgi:hypothetical protein
MRTARAVLNAVAVQEDHDLPHDLLLGPGLGDPPGAHRADACHLAQAIGFGFDHVEYFGAERLDQLPGVDRADAADHPGIEIFLDAFARGRGRAAQKAGFELLPVGAVVDPFAGSGDPFAGSDGRGIPTTVTSSWWPHAFLRGTQKPFAALWNVTRSMRPARTS